MKMIRIGTLTVPNTLDGIDDQLQRERRYTAYVERQRGARKDGRVRRSYSASKRRQTQLERAYMKLAMQ